MYGWKSGEGSEFLGHLTSSGTMANLEALWVAGQVSPGRRILGSEQAHYTHSRISAVLKLDFKQVATDNRGRMSIDALEAELRRGNVGTVVVTMGTTAIGAVDPLVEILALGQQYGFRVHVDAAYGGYFGLIADELDEHARLAYGAMGRADSIVIDPHKHGLQPYGCGCVLFRDPAVGSFYKHDSPYTYFTSSQLHLGEISLECSRAGAAAAALWLTLRVLPLTVDGLGAVLRACRQAAVRWSARAVESSALQLHQDPELDIVTYYPSTEPLTTSRIDTASGAVFDRAAHPDTELYLSLLQVGADKLQRRAGVVEDAPTARVLRSVLMKPEHELYVDELFDEVERIADNVRR
jgi:glutamate/tyrosine decarboxylase-like PLP-dependent enzyme